MKNISEHVPDIVQNSVRAKATISNDTFTIQINDNGCGMDKETLGQAASPFFTSRTTRKAGMGLPLLKQNAMASNGSFVIDSEAGKGTRVQAVFQLLHIDQPPAGDLWDTLYLLRLSNKDIRIVYRHRTPGGTFELDSEELMLMRNGVSLQQAGIKRAVID